MTQDPLPTTLVSGASGLSITTLGVVLLTACLVAMLSRRLHLPYSVGLVFAGLALAWSPLDVGLPLSRDLIFSVFLPPLVFEAALQLEWRSFRRELPITLTLAFPGVAIAAGVVACGAHWLLGWSWTGAGLFGFLIAATDPVAVIAMFKEVKVGSRLKMIVESESLLNDGVATVGFTLLSLVAAGAAGSTATMTLHFVWVVAGGLLAGALVCGILLAIAWRTQDQLVEITLTTLTAYGSFLLAERFGASGILASLTAGIILGNVGWRRAISESGRGAVLAFWAYAAFLANSIIFILIGGQEARWAVDVLSIGSLLAVLLVLLGRAMAIYGIGLALHWTPARIPLAHQNILFWGGLRGALALALALALPADLPERGEIAVLTFTVVAFSIFVQGLTLPALVRRAAQRGDARSAAEDGQPT